VVDLEGRVVEGALRPSSDTKTHIVLYRAFAGVRGICHSHSTNAVAWAQARRSIPCLGTTHADQTAFPIPCTAMISAEALARDYERGTGELIVDTFRGKDPRERPWSSSRAWALHLGRKRDRGRAPRRGARGSGQDGHPHARDRPPGRAPPEHVTNKHWERKHGKNAYYGQERKGG